MKLKRHKDFIKESTDIDGQSSTSAEKGYASSGSHPRSLMPQSSRGFTYYSWEDFINTDFKVYQDEIPDEEENDSYGEYKLLIGDTEYVLRPCLVIEKGVTNIHLVDLKDGNVFATISEEIPESKDLKEGEFYINPNINEYDSIIKQLIEQGFMVKKELSNQVVGEESSDIYKVLGF